VDLNQLKLDWVTSEAKRLKQRIIRIDIDFKECIQFDVTNRPVGCDARIQHP
jgi:hypothetical protein